MAAWRPPLFQFHYGTIKRKTPYIYQLQTILFQFHYGTIKSKFAKENGFQGFVFQFHYGTIKRCRGDRPLRQHNNISIPLWYD